MGRLTLMSNRGDTGEIWEVGDDGSVLKAETRFNELVKKGALAFEVTKPGEAEQIDKFNPNAEELILIPAIRGG